MVEFHAGLEGPFYGCDGYYFKIGETVYHCELDARDGYRSYMGEPFVWPGQHYAASNQNLADGMPSPIFFDTPLDTVWVCPDRAETEFTGPGEFTYSGWRLISVTSGRTWLRFGTDYSDSYYPQAEWEYTPLHDPNKEVH